MKIFGITSVKKELKITKINMLEFEKHRIEVFEEEKHETRNLRGKNRKKLGNKIFNIKCKI